VTTTETTQEATVSHPAVERARADVAAALAGEDWQARAQAAETRLAAVAAHCRERLAGAGRYGLSMTAARRILALAEGSSEEEADHG